MKTRALKLFRRVKKSLSLFWDKFRLYTNNEFFVYGLPMTVFSLMVYVSTWFILLVILWMAAYFAADEED
jgi:hypothetical protein